MRSGVLFGVRELRARHRQLRLRNHCLRDHRRHVHGAAGGVLLISGGGFFFIVGAAGVVAAASLGSSLSLEFAELGFELRGGVRGGVGAPLLRRDAGLLLGFRTFHHVTLQSKHGSIDDSQFSMFHVSNLTPPGSGSECNPTSCSAAAAAATAASPLAIDSC